MKLIKIFSRPQDIIGIIGKEKIDVTDNDQYVLVSDDKFKLLQFNHTNMVVIKEFSETAVADMGSFDKKGAYILERIDVADYASFDPSAYDEDSYVLVLEFMTTPRPGPAPVMRKPLAGFTFTPQEQAAALAEYTAALEAYETAVEEYETALAEFEETMEAVEFGYLIHVIDSTSYEVIADLSFETTKIVPQEHEFGKLPDGAPSLVTVAVGNFSEGDSIKGMSIVDILTTMLGLEQEDDVVGVVQTTSSSSSSDSSGESTTTETDVETA